MAKIDFVDVIRAPNSTISGATPVTRVLVGCNQKFFLGNFGSWQGYGSPTPYSTSSTEISTVGIKSSFFLVDGIAHTSGTLVKISAIDGTWSRIQTGGSGQPPARARLVATYRNRLVMSRTMTDSHNVFFSEVDNHTSFDYAAGAELVTGAVALNATNAPGRIGDEVTAFAAISKDYAVIGCQDSVWVLRGDPKAGGSVDNVSWGGGIVGQWAWARDAEGLFYYLTRTDLMVLAEGGVPKSISAGRIQKFLSGLDFSVLTPRLVWDQKNKGLWIFFQPSTQRPVTALHWDSRLDAFAKHQFPPIFGPTAAHSLTGEVYQEQQILIGGWDGKLWTIDRAWTTDHGYAISSYVKYPPVPLAPAGQNGLIAETELVIGAGDYQKLTASWYVGDHAQGAVADTTAAMTASTTTTGRYLVRSRIRGNAAVLKIANSTLARTWAIDQAHLVIDPQMGRTR